MSKLPTIPETWHQCRKCGEIFLAYSESSPCPACGTPKNLKINSVVKQSVATNIKGVRASAAEKREFQPNLKSDSLSDLSENVDDEVVAPPVSVAPSLSRRQARNPRRRFLMFGLCWVGIMVLVVVLLRENDNEVLSEKQKKAQEQAVIDFNTKSEDTEFINRANPYIEGLAKEFFSNPVPSVMTQICKNRPRIVQIIAAEIGKIPAYRSQEMPKLVASHVARSGDKMFLETLWKDYRNRSIELLFVEEDGEWKIDWELATRSSTAPWSLFFSENEDGEGVFRMLVRERKTVKPSERMISVAFHEPSLFNGAQAVVQTIPFEVDQYSRAGKLILAALEEREKGKAIFGSMYSHNDMEHTARVRVKIRRTNVNGVKTFTVEEVQACHWLGWDELGVDLPSEP